MDDAFRSSPLVAGVLVAYLLWALHLSHRITPVERRLVTDAAFLLAGIFHLTRAGGDPAAAWTAAVVWVLGLAGFARNALSWYTRSASPRGPLAAVVLLPPAFFGAALIVGFASSLIRP